MSRPGRGGPARSALGARAGDWRADLRHRVAEATDLLGSVPGVRGLLLGGSVGRGDPWPLSDVDILVVYDDPAAAGEFDRRRGLLEDFWSWSTCPGSLDAGALWFTGAEVQDVLAGTDDDLAARFGEPRWFHGVDKAYRGRALGDDPLVTAFAARLTAARFAPPVVAARLDHWRADATGALADALADATPGGDLAALHRAVEAAIEVLTEHWGWRSGSLDRRWTRFERYAAREGAAALADELLALRGARAPDVAGRLAVAPWWLRRRVRAAFEARRTVGEEVTRYENARDQLIAFAHLWRRRGLPEQAWTVPVTAGTPAEAVQRLRMLLDGAPFRPE